MLNSGDYTDIIRTTNAGAYTGGPDKAIEDGVFLELTDLIAKYAPNYSAKRAYNEDVRRQTVTDAGNIWSMYSMKLPAEYPWMGLAVRKDVLDDAGVALPATIADWETALTTLKDAGVSYPLMLDITGVSLNGEFLSAWNVGREFYQVDGEVRYGYIQPEFKEYLETMSDWYSKGLIDQEFTSHGISFAIFQGLTNDAFTALLTGNLGAGLVPWGYCADAMINTYGSQVENFWFEPVKVPVMNKGDQSHLRYVSIEAASANAISTTCKDPVLAVRLMDYLFTDEGSLLINYGVEGEGFNYVDGNPRWNDEILHDAGGMEPRSMSMKWIWDDGIGVIDFKRLWQPYEGTNNAAALEAYNVWNSDGYDYVLPSSITKTAEEGERYSSTYTDIQTYAQENIPQFIMGRKPLSDFDAFVNQIKGMGIDECIKIQQDALNRYLAR